MTDLNTTNDDAGSIRVTLDAALPPAGREAFTDLHGLAPAQPAASGPAWHAGDVRVSSDTSGRTWTFTATRDLGRAELDAALLARSPWLEHGGAVTAGPTMRYRFIQPPRQAPPLQTLIPSLQAPGSPAGWTPLTGDTARELPAYLASLAGDPAATGQPPRRFREGQHIHVTPTSGDPGAPPGGRPATIINITGNRLHAAVDFGDHGGYMLTFDLTDPHLRSLPPDPDASPFLRLAQWAIQPEPAPDPADQDQP